MKKKDFIEDLFKQTSSFMNEKQSSMAANLLDTVSSDIYSESQRFVFELIQNADDAAEGEKNEVHFNFLRDALIVSHNGKPFGEADIDSITDAGSSTKRDDPNKTGYKGIGFKSVFGMSERVSIFSDGYQFRFEKAYHSSQLPWQIIPIWSEVQDYSTEISLSLNQSAYNVTTVIELSGVDVLYHDLQEIMANGQILLFLRCVSKITVSKNDVQEYAVSKNIDEEIPAFSKVSLCRNTKVISEWLVKNYKAIPIPPQTREKLKQDTKAPEKLKNAVLTEMSFAARLEKGKITGISKGQSLIFTYLPTKVREFSFPFLVNGAFMTSAAREALFEDRLWNQWLFSLIAEKTISWLCELARTSYRLQILNILPSIFNQASNQLKESFDAAFTAHAKQGDFITTSQLSQKSSSSVLLDATGLSTQSFIDKSSITEFIRLTDARTFPVDCFVHAELEKPQLLKTIGVESFDKDNIGPYFSSDSFKQSHKLESNFQLIAYLKKLSDADSTGVWFQTLKGLPFIFDIELHLRNPGNGVCFPTGVSQTDLGNIPVIHNDVFHKIETDKPIYEWLGKLGVSEPSNLAYVTSVIIPNLQDPDYINIDNYLSITNYLFRLFHRGELTADMLESLRELKVLTTAAPAEFVVAQKTFLSNRYRPKFPIERTIAQLSFVAETYLANGDDLRWNEFFTAIKVKEDIEIEVINSKNDLETLMDLTDKFWVELARKEARAYADARGQWGFSMSNRISNLKIPSLLNLTAENYDYAVAFWKRLINAGSGIDQLKEKGSFLYGEGWGLNRFSAPVTNYFPWFVSNVKCIPTSTEELMLATDVFINTGDIKEIAGKLMPVFEYPTIVPTSWKVFFNFKSELLLTDYLLLLEKICSDAESPEPKERGRVQRIGMIYNKIATILVDTADEDKRIISDWAAQNRVLAGKDSFEDPATLKWITIPGFSDDSTSLKTIRIPSNTDLKAPGFSELMQLFGVQVISEFIPSYDQPIVDTSLKSKLEDILPHLVAVADKRTVGDPREKFDKLYDTLNQTTFFTAKEIRLCFDFEGKSFDGPTMTIYRDADKIYFKGKWKGERTLLHLIKELADLLKLRQLDGELRFLLMETDPDEIADWMAEQGIDLNTLVPKRRFTRQITIDLPQSVEYPLSASSIDQQMGSEAEEMLHHIEDDFLANVEPEVDYAEQTDNERQLKTIPVFIPVTSAKGLDFTTRPLSQLSTATISVSPQRQYEKVEDEEYRAKVGRWSEEYVNELLLQALEFSDVIWMNENGESRKPYDFTAMQNGKLIYIEVKGTQSQDKNLVYLSNGEWRLMKDNAENYIMFRVYEAGSQQSRHVVFENPLAMIDDGRISVALEL